MSYPVEYKQITNDEIANSDASILVDYQGEGEILVISFGFYVHGAPANFDFFGRLKKTEQNTGNNINKILIRDKSYSWYLNGIDELGGNVDSTIAELRKIIDKIKPSKIYTIGQSMGAYGAILYGSLLDVDKILAFAPLAYFDSQKAKEINDLRWLQKIIEVESNPPTKFYKNLPRVLAEHPNTRLELFYGYAGDGLDAINASYFTENSNAFLHSFPTDHLIVNYLKENYHYDRIIANQLFGSMNAFKAEEYVDIVSPSGENKKIPPGLIEKICIEDLSLDKDTKFEIDYNSQESIVVDIAGEYILKFPYEKRGEDYCSSQKTLANLIKENSPVATPHIEIGNNSSHEYIKYKKIKGYNFGKKSYSLISEEEKIKLAKDLAEFLYKMHSIDEKEIDKSCLNPSWNIEYSSLKETIHLSPRKVCDIIINAVNYTKYYQLKPEDRVFGHFDLHGSNILVSRENELCGVIDLGNCKFGDIHQDFSTINLISPDLCTRVISEYEAISSRVIDSKIVDYYTIYYLLSVIHTLKKRGDEKNFYKWQNVLLELCTEKESVLKIDKSWEEWVCENILNGAQPEELISIMTKKDLDESSSRKLVYDIANSPYLSVARKYQEKLHKREWLLSTMDWHQSQDEKYARPEKVPLPPFEDFLRDYYFRGRIGVFTGAIDHWDVRNWDFKDLVEKVGYDSIVEVQAERDSDADYEVNSLNHSKDIKFGEFIDIITSGESTNDVYMTANNKPFKNPAMKNLLSGFDNIGDGYFNMDKFTESAFLWLGPKGVITPLHHDLTNNFFVQVRGRKLYHLIPPMQVPHMYNNNHVYSDIKLLESDLNKFPEFKNANVIEIELEAGDCLFIPIGCWHHVVGLTENISMTLTNFNVNNHFPGYLKE